MPFESLHSYRFLFICMRNLYTAVHAGMEVRSQHQVFSVIILHHIYWRRSSHWTWSPTIRAASNEFQKFNNLAPTYYWGCRHAFSLSSFYMCAGNQNSWLHGYMAMWEALYTFCTLSCPPSHPLPECVIIFMFMII